MEEGVPMTREQLIDSLPGGKISGALLARDTWVHWIFAMLSGICFSVLFVLLFCLVKFIGFSYSCALQEGNGFVSSYFGFTLRVGICEELCKILPVIAYLGTAKKSTWQSACLVRFISCVALHSVWTGAGAVLLYGDQDFVHGGAEGTDMIATFAMTLGVPVILHGLYGTLLKQEMPVGALVVGLMSVSWLILVVEKLTRFEKARIDH